jgi:hypothetical protein
MEGLFNDSFEKDKELGILVTRKGRRKRPPWSLISSTTWGRSFDIRIENITKELS